MNVNFPLANAAKIAGVVVTAAAVLAVPAGNADAAGNAYGRQGAVYDYARVLSAEPNVRYVTVTTPVRECWEETRYYTVENRPAGSFAGTLMGAVIGGVVGHQFGSGRGNDAATVAGTLIGAAVGNDAAARRRGNEETTEYARPVKRCETKYQSHQEERIDGYRVVYEYHGQKYATDTPYDPGDRIRIRVDVRPAL
jgi:uncharacterized protein YcfJ